MISLATSRTSSSNSSIIKHFFQNRIDDVWNVRISSILLEHSILWEMWSLCPDVRVQHLMIIDSFACFNINEIWTYRSTGVHRQNTVTFSMFNSYCWIPLKKYVQHTSVMSVCKSWDKRDAFVRKMILRDIPKSDDFLFIPDWRRQLVDHSLFVTDVLSL